MREFSRKNNPFEITLELERLLSEYLEDAIPAIRKKKWEKPPFEKMGYSLNFSEKEWEEAEVQLRLSLYYAVSYNSIFFFPAFTLIVNTDNGEEIIGCIDDIENYNYGDPLTLYIGPDEGYDYDTQSHTFVRGNYSISEFKDFEIMDYADDSTIILGGHSSDGMQDYLADEHGKAVTDHMILFMINLGMQYKYNQIFQM